MRTVRVEYTVRITGEDGNTVSVNKERLPLALGTIALSSANAKGYAPEILLATFFRLTNSANKFRRERFSNLKFPFYSSGGK